MGNNYQSQVDQATTALKNIQDKVEALDSQFGNLIQTINTFNGLKTPSGISSELNKTNEAIKTANALVEQQSKNTKAQVDAEEKLNTVFKSKIPTLTKLADFNNKIKESQDGINHSVTSSISTLKQLAAVNKQNVRDAQKEIDAKRQKIKATLDEQQAIQSNKDALQRQKAAYLQLNRPYNQLLQQQRAAKQVLQDATVAQGKNSAETRKAQREYDRLTAKVNQANKATSNFANTGLGSAVRGLRNLMSAFGVIGGVTLFASIVREGFNLTKQLDSLSFSMKAVIKDSEELANTQVFLREIAQKYGGDLLTITNRYIKFRAATQQAGLTALETQKIFSTMTKAAGVLGLKKDELQGIFLALEQMVSKGKITTEELRRQLGERLPGATDIMANSLGVTTSELDKMLKKGEVLTKDVLPGFADEVERAFGLNSIDKVRTFQAATTRFSNAWTILVDEFRTGNQATNLLMRVFDALANNLGTIVKFIGYAALAWAGYKTVKATAWVITQLFNKALWEERILLALVRLETIKATIATKGFTAALLTNPITLAVVGLTALYFALRETGDGAAEAAKEITKANKELTEQNKITVDTVNSTKTLIDRYEELTKKAKDLGDVTKLSADEQKELRDIIKKIGEVIPDAVTQFGAYNEIMAINTETAKEWLKTQAPLQISKANDVIRDQTKVLLEQESVLRKVNKLNTEGRAEDINGYAEVIKLENGRFKARKENSIGFALIAGQEHTAMLQFIADAEERAEQSKNIIHSNEDLITSITGVLNVRQKEQKTNQLREKGLELGIKEQEMNNLTLKQLEEIVTARQKEAEAIDNSQILLEKYDAEMAILVDKLKEIEKGGVAKIEFADFEKTKQDIDDLQKKIDFIRGSKKTGGGNKAEREDERRLKAEIKAAKAAAKAKNDAVQSGLEIQINANKAILEDEERNGIQRFLAMMEFEDKSNESALRQGEYEKEIAQLTLDGILRSKLRSDEEKITAQEAYNDRLLAIDNEYTDAINQNETERIKNFDDITQSEAEKLQMRNDHKIAIIEQGYGKEKALAYANFNNAKAILDYQLKNRFITQKVYNDRLALLTQAREDEIAKIEREASIESLKLAISLAEQKARLIQDPLKRQAAEDAIEKSRMELSDMVAKNAIKNSEDEANALQNLLGLKKELRDFMQSFQDDFFSDMGFDKLNKLFLTLDENGQSMFDNLLAAAEPGMEKFAVYFNTISEVAQEAFNFISKISQQRFDEEYKRLDKQKEVALQFAGDSAAAKEEIEAQYEEKRKEIQKRQAKAQKEQAMFNAVINTAQAVVSMLAEAPWPSNFVFAALVGAMGAAQIALIASQKTPEFFRGTMNAPEGYAKVDEKGAEVHTDRQGRVKSWGEDKANLRYLSAGDKIYRTKEMYFQKELNTVLKTNDIFPYNEIMGNMPSVVVESKGLTAGEMDSIIGKHFKNIQVNKTSIDKNGVHTWVENSGSKTISLNNRVSHKGFSV